MGSCWTRENPPPIIYKDTDFDRWNEESIASTFIRLMTKNNFPYDKNMLTEKEFNYDYDLLESYIKWCEKTNTKVASYCYDFSFKNMSYFLSLIRYDMENRGDLVIKWKTLMYRF